MSITSAASKQDVYKYISNSASYGNLGLFVGSGFSKAVLNDDGFQIALSWRELLEKVCKSLDINYNEILESGMGYPDIATKICIIHAENSQKEYREALSDIKRKIANLTSWYPTQEKRKEFGEHLAALLPSWIVTTNYDLVIESLLTGKCIPLGPSDQLTNPKNIIPIYHLHGIRTNPEEIVISQEDFVQLFRPNEYRQIKLALTLKESTVLFLGYGLGDVNVLTALDWSKNVFERKTNNFPQDVIQVLKKSDPSDAPYRDRNGILIIETDEISTFFNEYAQVRKEEFVVEVNRNELLSELQKALSAPSQEIIEKFIDNVDYRKSLIQELAGSPMYLASGFISFLDKCLTETWTRSDPKNAFEAYNQNLILLLDILTGFSAKNIPPALFQTAAYGLERVAPYIGKDIGKSHAAARTWENRKDKISTDMVKELKNIARQYSYIRLIRLLNTK